MMPLRLLQISDCHLFADPKKRGYGDINPYRTLQKVLAEATRLSLDRVLFTGDISGDHSTQSYRHLQTLWQQSGLTIPCSLLPGNHDDPRLLGAVFGEHLDWLQQPLQYGNWRLHALDSHFQGTLGRVSEAQLEALQARLDKAPDAFHLIAVHHHPLASASWMDRHEWVNREVFLRLLEGRAQIKAVIHGHLHSAITNQYSGIPIWSCPSSCWQWQLGPEFAVADEAPGCRLLQCEADGQIRTAVIRISTEQGDA